MVNVYIFWGNSYYNKFKMRFLGLVFIVFVLGCSFTNINVEPIAATVTELSACNENGESIDVFLPEKAGIFVCGYVQTLQPVDINIYWYYEDELVFQQIGENIDGDFYSFVQPGKVETFPEGNYRIDILIGGVVAESTEFRVKQP